MLIAKKYEVPDECPENCPHRGEVEEHLQSAICWRCPVLACFKDDNGICMVEAEEYRPDWAKIWQEWFRTGMKSTPRGPWLPFTARKKS